MVWQGPRIRRGAETGTQVIITALSTIFYFVFLLAFEVVSLCVPLVFLPRAVLAPVSSYSSCYLARAAVFLLAAFRIFLRHLYFVSFQLSLCFVLFLLSFFCYYFLVRLVFAMLSYPVRWHFTCFTLIRLRLFFGGFLCITVCDHRICISLGWSISTDTGCTCCCRWVEWTV